MTSVLNARDVYPASMTSLSSAIIAHITNSTSALPVEPTTISDWYEDLPQIAAYQLIEDSPLFQRFTVGYQRIHGYLAIVVCSFGIVSNVTNIVVLTRRAMTGATNYLLTALAVVDLLTMTSYLPYAAYFFCIATPNTDYAHSRGLVIYLLVTTNLFITFHTSAMWLTVALAVFRYFVVCLQSIGATGIASLRRARATVVVIPAITVLFCVPNYVMYRPERQSVILADNGYENNGSTTTQPGYWFVKNDFVTPALETSNFWLYGVVLKVAPCVLLTVLSAQLIRSMSAAELRRRRLLSVGNHEESERTVEHNRTTAMLVVVVLFFVLGELPQGVLALLASADRSVFYSVYVPLGDVLDIIVLVNSAVNFVLYCIMSRQFRATFCDVFCGRHRCGETGRGGGRGGSGGRSVAVNGREVLERVEGSADAVDSAAAQRQTIFYTAILLENAAAFQESHN